MPTEAETTLGDLLSIAHRRRSILGKAFLMTVITAAVVAAVRAPQYEASSTLIADKNPPVVLMAAGRESSLIQQPLAQAPDVFTLTELAKSEGVRDLAIERLAGTFGAKRAENILHSVRVQQVRSTELVRISVKYRDPAIAAAAANAVADSLVEMDLKARRRQATVASDFVGKQLELAGQDLRSRQQALAAFKNESHDVSLSDQTQLNLRKLADLDAALTDVHQQQAQAGFAGSSSTSRRGAPLDLPDPVITTLQSQLASLQVDYSGLRKQFTTLHPQVLSTQAKIDETQRRLSAEIARRQAALSARERSLLSEIAKIEQGLMQVPSREAALTRLTLDAKEAERKYLLLSEKFQEARIAEGSIGSAVRVVDFAKTSGRPVGQRSIILLVGAILGLLMGIAAVFTVEQLDETVKSIREVERLLGVPVLGSVSALPVGEASSDARAQTPALSLVPAAFRVLRTHALQAMREANAKSLLVTSAMPGEGKSTIAANLALAVAQTDRRVWLVDCDLRRPVLNRLFSEARSEGLSSFLTGRATIEDIVRRTRHLRLDCVVAGSEVPDPTELLDTQRMTQFLHQARDSADVVILDGGALLAAADAEVIGLQADAVTVVVQLGKTDRRALARSRQDLARLGVHVIGVVLNEGKLVTSATDDSRISKMFDHVMKALRARGNFHLPA